MDFAASLLNFLTPTHIHNFDNHSNGYGCLKDNTRAKLVDCWKTASLMVGNPETVSELDEDYDFL
jgi:hypothetical protein